MTASESFVELIKDALSGLGPVSVRRMFGGAGIYADGVMFGLIAGDTLYLKADSQSQHAFEAEGASTVRISGPRQDDRHVLLEDSRNACSMTLTKCSTGRGWRLAAARRAGAKPGRAKTRRGAR